ncbi:MAG: alpha/beta hydrolase [Bacteroidetes bacterium]|nr:alpha/beta hydrolase [Bacteroidota bacterium]
MNSKHILVTILTCLIGCSSANAQQKILYKQIGDTKLYMEIYNPESMDSAKKYPVIVFYFGGGWSSGSTSQFEPHAKYFTQRGMVCVLVDYRVKDRQQTTPFESLKDAKSSIRFLRDNANKFHIDTSKIVAAGGSAGGHLAAATALINDYNEISDNKSTSCIPNALVLYNPVIDNGPGGYGYNKIGEAYKNFSPLHNIREGMPPAIIFLGTNDELIPVETVKYFQKAMEKVKSQCVLKLYDGQGHGFFNYKNLEYYKKTVFETDAFLQSIGYLKEIPVVEIK